jgi:hypothetical protein
MNRSAQPSAVQSYQRSSEKTTAIFFLLLNKQLLQIAPNVTSMIKYLVCVYYRIIN